MPDEQRISMDHAQSKKSQERKATFRLRRDTGVAKGRQTGVTAGCARVPGAPGHSLVAPFK